MQNENICLCCHQEETAPVWAPVVIYVDFDECGQEYDPIVTDNYDLAGFEDYCPTCRDEFDKQRDAYASSDDLPF